MPTVPFTAAQVTAIRYYCGYPAYAAYGYILAEDMATLDTQIANMSDTEQAVVVTEFLSVLPGLKTAIDGASATLMVGEAGPFIRNPQELSERMRLYNNLRLRLCAFIGIPPGDGILSGGKLIRT